MVTTIIHITHWKAGSSWIRRILRQLASDRYVTAETVVQPMPPGRVAWVEPSQKPIPAGAVCSRMSTREQYEAADLPGDSRRFVVIRDLRDTLVSAYFGFRYSPLRHPTAVQIKTALDPLDQEGGMIAS